MMFVLSSPSGVGKTTLTKKIAEHNPGFKISISHTTRKPRPNEVNGKDYHFVNIDKFKDLIEKNNFFEYANIFDMHAWEVLQYEWEHLPCEDGYVESAPVGSYKPNAFGLYDMLGNVWEWTEDCLAYTFRPSNGTSSEAVLRGDCSQRAYRGASWLNHPAKYIGPSDRYKYLEAKESDLGFRLVREIE